MTDLERQEFTDRIRAMSDEEKTIAVSLMPDELLFNTLIDRYLYMCGSLDRIKEALQ